LTVLTVPLSFAQNDDTAGDELTYELVEQLVVPLKKKVNAMRDERGDEGRLHRRGSFSKNFKKIDDDTYQVSFQRDTASKDTLTSERLLLTLKRKGAESWEIVNEELVDTYELHRQHGYRIYPFAGFAFDKGGLSLSASQGYMVESYFAGEVDGFFVIADDLQYKYTPPKYKDYDAVYATLLKDYSEVLIFKPQLFAFQCDPQSCDELMAESFTGLKKPSPEEAGPVLEGPDDLPDWVDPSLKKQYVDEYKDMMEQRRENPFAHFSRGSLPGNRWYAAAVEKNDKHVVALQYDNWEGFEYQFWVVQDAPGSTFWGPVFGYYTDETLANHTAYQLEQRDDIQSRWHEVYKVKGQVEVALEDDEVVDGQITFGIHLKQDTKELPFQIFSRRTGMGSGERFKHETLFVNSVSLEGIDLTAVKTGSFSYLLVFPQVMPAGTKIELDVDFSSRLVRKATHSYMGMPRQGWLPFVRFGDPIDEFDLVVKTPAAYEVLGVGRRVSEKKEGDVLVTRWVAESPVTFPTIIFGRYRSDTPRFAAEKADGTEIPVTVYVDEASFSQWRIGPDSLRPIAEQAANAVNLYREISGVDYPYGELNLVADPTPAMRAQSPSSIVYVGARRFQSKSEASRYIDAEGMSIFLDKMVAHEVGHQWWGSGVAHANYRNYWFIEALAEYFTAVWFEATAGESRYMDLVNEWTKAAIETDHRASVQDAATLRAGESPSSTMDAIYYRGAFAFHVLRQTFGDEKFFPALKQIYIELADKGEVVTEDIRTAAERAFGGVGPDGQPYHVDLSWFFDQWIRGVGIPQYSFTWDTRRAEDGTWIVEGRIRQRVLIGNRTRYHVMDGKYYRGVVQVTVTGKDKKEYPVRFAIEGPETPFAFKVPVAPRDVVLNEHHELLSHETLVGRDF
jgi:hypothetical protein